MIDVVIKNNISDFDFDLLEYSIQIKGLNYLKKNNYIGDNFYNDVKSVIAKNYTIAISKNMK